MTKVEDIKTLDWDTDTGKPPKVGQVIENTYGDRFEVIARRGNKVTLKKLPKQTA